MAGSRILYHVSKHPHLFPKPLRTQYENRKFPWGEKLPEEGIWLSPNHAEVQIHHGIKGSVHAFRVSNEIIKDSGGTYDYDGAREIVISKELWERGITDGSIKYLGKVSEKKKTPKSARPVSRPRPKEPSAQFRISPLERFVDKMFYKGLISPEKIDDFERRIKQLQTADLPKSDCKQLIDELKQEIDDEIQRRRADQDQDAYYEPSGPVKKIVVWPDRTPKGNTADKLHKELESCTDKLSLVPENKKADILKEISSYINSLELWGGEKRYKTMLETEKKLPSLSARVSDIVQKEEDFRGFLNKRVAFSKNNLLSFASIYLQETQRTR